MNNPHLRLHSGLALLSLVACAQSAHAQSSVAFTSLVPYVENFDDLNTAFPAGIYANNGLTTTTYGTTFPAVSDADAGTKLPTVPVLIQPGLAVNYPVTGVIDFNRGGIIATGGGGSTINSLRALRDGATGDFAIGGKLGTTVTLTGLFTNQTGAEISSWNVSYNVERYSNYNSAAPTTIAFGYSADGSAFTPLGAAYSYAGDGVSAGTILASVASTAYTQDVPLTVAAGASIYLRWTFVDPNSNGRHVAIDDLVVTPIPEPAAAAALAGVAFLAIALARRRA